MRHRTNKFSPVIDAASCSTVKVCPAIVNDADTSPPLFGATKNVTVPLPKPEEALVSVTLAGRLPTVHRHPPGAVMVIVPVPPAAVKTCPPELSAKLHSGGAS